MNSQNLELFAEEVLEDVLDKMGRSGDVVENIIANDIRPYFDEVVDAITTALTTHMGDYRMGKATVVIKTEDGLLKLRFKDLNREIRKEEKERGEEKKRKSLEEYLPYWVFEEYVIAKKEGWIYKFTIDLTEEPKLVVTTTKIEREQKVYAL